VKHIENENENGDVDADDDEDEDEDDDDNANHCLHLGLQIKGCHDAVIFWARIMIFGKVVDINSNI